MIKIEDYIPIVGNAVIDDLKRVAEKLKNKKIKNINSTPVGGGVAEILSRIVPLLNELGVKTIWDVIKGGKSFFEVTKKFHNALHGKKVEITKKDFNIFLETSDENINQLSTDEDIIFVHDPQPITLIEKKKDNKWIWRCHIDVSNPDKKLWNFLKKFIIKYDATVFSAPSFSSPLPVRQFLISPSIDPLSDKNRELTKEEIDGVVKKYEIPRDKPLITQISRFDRLKDPLGVIEVYKKVKKNIDCRLLLAGGTAIDDPEGMEVYNEVMDKAKHDKDIIVLNMEHNDLEINALQRISNVIIQKSIKEGFGLTVTEALWKGKPVVASNVGGISLQITHKYSGLLCYSIDGAAFAVKQILNNPEYGKKLGQSGREHVRNNFLITRHLKEYMLLFLSLYYNEDIIYL